MSSTPIGPDVAAALVLRQRRRRSRQARLVALFFASVLLLDALFGERGLWQTTRARQELQQTARRLDALKRENDALRDEVRRLQEDPATLEAVARRDLGLIRRGEILVVLTDAK